MSEIPRWKINNRVLAKNKERLSLFGDALVAVSDGLRPLSKTQLEWDDLRRTASNISVPIAKILLGRDLYTKVPTGVGNMITQK